MTDPVSPPPPPQPTPYAAPTGAVGPKTNTLAIIALVLGFVFPLGGIIVGHIALNQLKRTGEAGHGLALAGTILGYVFTVFWIIFLIVYVVFIASIAANYGNLGTYGN
jgi:ABC-type antimicrobial peptide transport system permease subunit